MTESLRVLIIEDSVDDTFFILRELQRGGFLVEFERVDTPTALQTALAEEHWDLVISDYSMPQLGGPAALALFQRSELEIPFIFVSGAMGEHLAVEMLKAGADEYVMKDKLEKLVPAVRNELRAAQERRIRRQTEATAAYLASLVESCEDSIIGTTTDGTIVSWNAGAARLYGYAGLEVIGQHISLLFPPYRPEAWSETMEKLQQGKTVERQETMRLRKDGTPVEVSVTVSPIRDTSGHVIGCSSIARDISLRRQEENERLALIQELTEALSHSSPGDTATANSGPEKSRAL
jgi:PAS domain S-box-containing protein